MKKNGCFGRFMFGLTNLWNRTKEIVVNCYGYVSGAADEAKLDELIEQSRKYQKDQEALNERLQGLDKTIQELQSSKKEQNKKLNKQNKKLDLMLESNRLFFELSAFRTKTFETVQEINNGLNYLRIEVAKMTTMKAHIILAKDSGEIEYTIVRSYKNGDEEITEEITMPIADALKFVDEEIGKCNEFISEMKYKLINFEERKQEEINELEAEKGAVQKQLDDMEHPECFIRYLFEV